MTQYALNDKSNLRFSFLGSICTLTVMFLFYIFLSIVSEQASRTKKTELRSLCFRQYPFLQKASEGNNEKKIRVRALTKSSGRFCHVSGGRISIAIQRQCSLRGYIGRVFFSTELRYIEGFQGFCPLTGF